MTSIAGYDSLAFEFAGISHQVYRRGAGPGVLIMHELPGLSPACLALASEVASNGFTVFLPLFFGSPNQPKSAARTAANLIGICVNREFSCFAAHKSSPVTEWLRALCRDVIRPNCSGRGIGAIGMCLTGGLVIPLMLTDFMLAPVVCQPALPFGLSREKTSALGASAADWRVARASDLPLLGFRFQKDWLCRSRRFDTISAQIGSRFERHDLPGSGHSTLTARSVGSGSPIAFARQRVLEFLRVQLQ